MRYTEKNLYVGCLLDYMGIKLVIKSMDDNVIVFEHYCGSKKHEPEFNTESIVARLNQADRNWTIVQPKTEPYEIY